MKLQLPPLARKQSTSRTWPIAGGTLLKHTAVAALFAFLSTSVALAALPPPKPYPLRIAANGRAVAVMDHAKGALTDLWLHPYQAILPGQLSQDVLHDAYFGLRSAAGTGGQWGKDMALVGCAKGQACLGDQPSFGYLDASGIIVDKRSWTANPKVELHTFAWVPQSLKGRGFVLLAQVVNGDSADQTLELAALLNFHVGPGAPQPADTPEEISKHAPRALYERSSASPHRLWVRAVDGLAADAAQSGPGTPQTLESLNPYNSFQSGAPLGTSADAGPGADRVGGMLWKLQVPAGKSATVALLTLYGDGATAVQLASQGDQWLQGRSAGQLLQDEQTDWQTWHAKAAELPGLSAEDLLIYRRSLMLLRMAQCREDNLGPAGSGLAPQGQIVASLPPGMWNITWPRDQSYAGVALAATGHLQEAKAALEFLLRGKVGQFQKEVGAPYLISATRYWGGGTEESDFNEFGPNIELDGFGLVLWQAARYFDASADGDFLAQWWPSIRDLIANPLMNSTDDTGLVKKDSSIWEVHWNGQEKHFAYTSLTAVRGLCGAARLATAAGEGKLAGQYRSKAKAIHQAIQTKLAPGNGFLLGNLEEPPAKALDLAAVEAFVDGQFSPWGQVAQASWSAWQQLAAGGGPGFFRNDDGGEYDSQEWLFIDLRVLRWLDRAVAAGAPLQVQLDQLRERLRLVARQGGGILPELLGNVGANAGQFAGAVPMMGFGAGAALLALGGEAYGDDLSACLQAGEPVGPDAGAGPDAGGPVDAGDVAPADSEPTDAGPTDANPTDAGPADTFDSAGDISDAADAPSGDAPSAEAGDAAKELTNSDLTFIKDAPSPPSPAPPAVDSGCHTSPQGQLASLVSLLTAAALIAARRRGTHVQS
jgi:GH15 family glucan-1,4-alpha-glucosidase